MERSGMDRALEHMAETGRDVARTWAWSTGNPHATWNALATLLRRDALAKPAANCVTRGLEPDHLPSVLGWIRSPLGEKVRRLEEDAVSPGQYDAHQKFVNRLPDKPVPAARLAAVRTLEEGGRLTERQVALERAMRTAIARAMGRPAEDDYDEAVDRLVAEERGRFWFMTASLFAYQSLTDDELTSYIRFDRSPAGVWFSDLYWRCLDETVKATGQRATEALRSQVQRPRP
jgi:hypothetical protein